MNSGRKEWILVVCRCRSTWLNCIGQWRFRPGRRMNKLPSWKKKCWQESLSWILMFQDAPSCLLFTNVIAFFRRQLNLRPCCCIHNVAISYVAVWKIKPCLCYRQLFLWCLVVEEVHILTHKISWQSLCKVGEICHWFKTFLKVRLACDLISVQNKEMLTYTEFDYLNFNIDLSCFLKEIVIQNHHCSIMLYVFDWVLVPWI